MNSKFLDKWKVLDNILSDNLFEIKYTIDSWTHNYYSDTFDGRVEYDIGTDSCDIIDSHNNIIVSLVGDNLNEYTLSQYLIEHVGK